MLISCLHLPNYLAHILKFLMQKPSISYCKSSLEQLILHKNIYLIITHDKVQPSFIHVYVLRVVVANRQAQEVNRQICIGITLCMMLISITSIAILDMQQVNVKRNKIIETRYDQNQVNYLVAQDHSSHIFCIGNSVG